MQGDPEDVHDVMELAISAYGERGTTNRYHVRVRMSVRQRQYPNQTWRYENGKLLSKDPKDGASLIIVRRS